MKKLLTFFLGLALILGLSSGAFADRFWGAAAPAWSNGGAVLFELDTTTGTIGTMHSYSDWSWIMDVTGGPCGVLYVVHNTVTGVYDHKLAKVDSVNGTVLSDTLLRTLTDTDFPIWNALEYRDDKLYGIENNNWGPGSTAGQKRGYVYQVTLDTSGDPVSATLGAYVGGYPAPDGALAYCAGKWYASDWKTNSSSWIKTTTDIMATNFTATDSTSPVGLISGWDFQADGTLLGVSWGSLWYYSPPGLWVFSIDLPTGAATQLYDLSLQLPSDITMLTGLSNTVQYYTCTGFEPPMDKGAVKVKKNRVLPLKTELLNCDGEPVTDADLTAQPVIQVIFQPAVGDAEDVTGDALPAGQGTEGNQFEFSGGKWQFNLKTKNYSGAGTYTITMVSGNECEYIIEPTCTAAFVIE